MYRRLLKLVVRAGGFAAYGLVTLGSAACSHVVENESPARLGAAVVNGELSDETDDAVVSIGSACTGTMVAPNLVFTAVHCVAYYTGGQFRCSADGTLTSTNPGDGTLGALVRPEQIAVFSGVVPGPEPDAVGARLFGTGTSEICQNDFAIVLLDRELDLPVVPIRMDRRVRRGETMRVVGYGLTEKAMDDVARRRRTGVTVVDVAPDSGQGTAAPRTFVLSEGACIGDSGGPAFSEETGALTGVYSLAVGASCTTQGVRNVYTRIAPFASLIEQAFAASGYEPILEPPGEPDPEPVDPGPDPFAGSGSRSGGCALGGRQEPAAGLALALAALALAGARRRRRDA